MLSAKRNKFIPSTFWVKKVSNCKYWQSKDTDLLATAKTSSSNFTKAFDKFVTSHLIVVGLVQVCGRPELGHRRRVDGVARLLILLRRFFAKLNNNELIINQEIEVSPDFLHSFKKPAANLAQVFKSFNLFNPNLKWWFNKVAIDRNYRKQVEPA